MDTVQRRIVTGDQASLDLASLPFTTAHRHAMDVVGRPNNLRLVPLMFLDTAPHTVGLPDINGVVQVADDPGVNVHSREISERLK